MNINKEVTKILKNSLRKSPYWTFIQDEVKEKVETIVNNFAILGPLFKDAFLASFKYEHARRMAGGESVPVVIPGVLFGEKMSEECYQSGINPAKSLLQLNDWTMPNEADVQLCIALCHHAKNIEALSSNHAVDLLSEPPLEEN